MCERLAEGLLTLTGCRMKYSMSVAEHNVVGRLPILMARGTGRTTGRGVLRWLSYLLLSVVVVAFIFVFVASRWFDWRFDAVLTGSMTPTYKVGGMVVIRPVDPAAVVVGDVITYDHPVQTELLVTHRVVSVYPEGDSLEFQTKGDAVPEEDGYRVPSETVRGTVCLYVPLFGRFAEFVKTPLGFTVCLIVPSFLLLMGEFKRVAAAIRARTTGGGAPTTKRSPDEHHDSRPGT